MHEMTEREQLAALEGWACNKAVPLEERLESAMQVISGLRKIIHDEGCIVEVIDCICGTDTR